MGREQQEQRKGATVQSSPSSSGMGGMMGGASDRWGTYNRAQGQPNQTNGAGSGGNGDTSASVVRQQRQAYHGMMGSGVGAGDPQMTGQLLQQQGAMHGQGLFQPQVRRGTIRSTCNFVDGDSDDVGCCLLQYL